MAIKTFVPIVLIVVCAALVFFVRPRHVEARIGLGLTVLLTLVALQITSGASLPDFDYLSRPHRPSGKSAVIGLALRHSFGAVPCHALAGRMPNTEIRPLPLMSRGPRSSASKWAET
jgi:hypothetical protein